MIASLPPGFILILGGLLAPLVPARARPAYMLALPVLGFIHLSASTLASTASSSSSPTTWCTSASTS